MKLVLLIQNVHSGKPVGWHADTRASCAINILYSGPVCWRFEATLLKKSSWWSMKCCLRMSKRKGVNSCSKGLHLNAGREQIELETSTFPRCKTPCHYHCSSPIIFLFLFFNQPLNCNAQLSVSLAVSFVQSTSSPFPPHQSPQLHYPSLPPASTLWGGPALFHSAGNSLFH